ncbi:uncharacterized protein LOC143361583 [Halictus rubicundus]|uniref:uncharacterized protein LOC143361583 n=1 Tax=Halictus rubicundus TaxID=77578 RepID=UPI004036C467
MKQQKKAYKEEINAATKSISKDALLYFNVATLKKGVVVSQNDRTCAVLNIQWSQTVHTKIIDPPIEQQRCKVRNKNQKFYASRLNRKMLNSMRRCMKVLYHKIRKSLHVSDFVTLMQPYISVISALGYFPYDTKLSSTKLAKMSFIGSVIKMIHITLLCPFIIYHTKFIEGIWKESSAMIHMISVYTLGLVGLWATFVSSRSKLHLLRMISTASRVLSCEVYCRTAKWMFTIDIVRVCIFTTFIFDLEGELWMLVAISIAIYMFLVATALSTLFINCLYVMYLCFRKMNTSLEKLKMNLATDEPHLLRRVYHSQKNPALLSELKMLRRQHIEFSSIIDAFNEAFGLEIIVIVALTVMDMTFNLYLYLTQNTDDGKIVSPWSRKMMYVGFSSLALIALAVVCEKVKDQGKDIGSNIHRILVITYDEQISTER